MVTVLSFDPGETTGWAYQDERDDFPGGIIDLGQIKGIQEFAVWLEAFKRPVDHVCIEKYVVWGGKRGSQSNIGTEVESAKIVGIIEGWCLRNGIPYTKYESKDLNLYAKQTGLNPRIGAHKNSHWAFAAVYGRKWLQDNHGAKTALQRKIKK